MKENLNNWSATTANLYKAVLIYTCAAIAAAVFGFIGSIGDTASTLSSLAEGRISGGGFGFWDALDLLATVALIYGYWLFLQSLSAFKGLVDPADAPRIGSIYTSTILLIVGAVAACIPMLGFAGDILNLIAWIMLLLAYSNLKNSATFPEKGRLGMSKLFTAMILGIIGWVVDFIPLIGDAAETILEIIAFFMILSGWKRISESEAPAARA